MATPATVPTRGIQAPGPKGRPLFGSLPDFRADPLQLMLEARAAHGDVVRFRYLGPFSWLLFAHPDHVQHALQAKYQNYRKGVFGQIMKIVTGEGLVAVDGAEHLRQRRMLQPGFHPARLPDLGSAMLSVTESCLDGWREAARSGQPLDMVREMRRFAMQVAARTLFSSDLGDAFDGIEQFTDSAVALLGYRFTHPLSPWPFLPTPQRLAYDRTLARAEATFQQMIDARRTRPVDRVDLLTMLMAATDPETGDVLSDDEIRAQIRTFLVAGYESSASTLAWALLLVARHPEVEQRLRDEVDGLGFRPVGVHDLPRLTYVRQVLDETLRLYPPFPLMGRQASEDDVVDGYRVRKDTVVCICCYVTHRHPDFWPDAERFDPDRFLPERTAGRHKLAYFPFGAGPRVCIGNHFALMEMTLLLARLVQRWRLELVPDAMVERSKVGPLRPVPAVPMRVFSSLSA